MTAPADARPVAVRPPGDERPSRARLRALVTRRFEQSIDVPTRFFDTHADAISGACLAMARRFQLGGRLLVFGDGADATDAQHVAVEFIHPVIVGKRALPALALTSDVATLTGAARRGGADGAFARVLEVIGREHDIALAICGPGGSARVLSALARARAMRMLTIALVGGEDDAVAAGGAHFAFPVRSADPMVVQEVHETLYHVLWELVHVFFEHRVVQ